MWDTISQISIFSFGVLSIILVARKNKWGFVLGLVSQPFWYITSYVNHQWGVFFLNIAYTLSWSYGVYKWFWEDKKEELKNIK